MPNLVGIGNSQVPTNSMLGGLAYQDPTHANLENVDIKDIAAIKNRINTQGRHGNNVAADTTIADIFVYDTRNDSDGGAWRKRTQHTSWYNESLNTEFRGGRREFPSIAVLVSHEGNSFYGFSIYDGDDPSLPLWMHFHIEGYNPSDTWGSGLPMIGRATGFVPYNAGPICAMNGQISLGNKNTGNGAWHPGWMVNMISEKCIDLINYGSGDQCYWMSSNIADRVNYENYTVMEWSGKRSSAGDDKHSHGKSGMTGAPDTGEIRSIAMTVTPDALIDEETGLPVPTQVWAGKNGLAVLKGSTNSWVTTQSSNHTDERAEFNSKFDIVTINRHGSSPNCVQVLINKYPNYNAIVSTHYYHANRSCITGATMGTVFTGYEDLKFMKNPYGDVDDLALIPSSNVGLNLYLGDGNDGGNTNKTSICARITPDYNTGWMMGICEMALMMDTSPTNITAAVHQYSDFSSAGGWGSGAAGSSISGGTANLPNQGSSRVWHTTYLVANTKYMCEYKVANNVDDWVFDDDGGGFNGGSTTNYHGNTNNANGTFSFVFTSTASTRLRIMRNGTTSSTTINIDYVRIHKIEQDTTGVLGCNNRQIPNHPIYGCATFGTLVRNSVSTTSSSNSVSGVEPEKSDVVAYSSWSGSNYLIRGYSSDFDIATNSFVTMGWVFPSTSNFSTQTLCGIGDFDANNGFIIQMYGGAAASGNHHTGNWRLDAGYLGTNNSFSSSNGGTAVIGSLTGNKWNMWVVYNKNNTFRMFINGQFAGSWGASSVNWTTRWNSPHLLIGGRPGVNSSLQACAPDTRQAMVRWGQAASSWDDDKFRQIYEDEKQLFRPGAKAVLTGGRGSSYTVKDIDFDTKTNTLHVASQHGTSEFRRLVRINSTVGNTSLISAQGGMVVEVP
tara:strand:- start:711 stop:3398 length:2688 start_codon:yes stop_codon:yes gene_type:complete